jgi:hypothetical protein
MKRRAILIEAADFSIPGAKVDVEYYRQYLTSQTGGAWYANEIVTLVKPPLSELRSEIRKAELEAEYLFISFSGHGYMKRRTQNASPPQSEKELTIICLNDVQEISLQQINPSIKNFVIIDSCREYEKLTKAMKLENLIRLSEEASRDVARELFDDAITAAGAGQILAFSCGINEAAGEDPNRGGHFSVAMMECGKSFSKHGQQRAICTDEIFACAYKKVKTFEAQQNPKYLPGRRLNHFPFAVRV